MVSSGDIGLLSSLSFLEYMYDLTQVIYQKFRHRDEGDHLSRDFPSSYCKDRNKHPPYLLPGKSDRCELKFLL